MDHRHGQRQASPHHSLDNFASIFQPAPTHHTSREARAELDHQRDFNGEFFNKIGPKRPLSRHDRISEECDEPRKESGKLAGGYSHLGTSIRA